MLLFKMFVTTTFLKQFTFKYLRDRLQLSMFKKEEQRSSLWVGGSE